MAIMAFPNPPKMVCLSHQPDYFSIRWNINGPNIPLFHYSNFERSEHVT
ncbi:hypothetical protein D1AOALGA4SA_5454 [Olavius algarvensis Delta 1 endosymbiont]|nr:hypothetical protein D1AOALGA4SA_5454 [Olavius algarvensis Delta 1 endosymbiont]